MIGLDSFLWNFQTGATGYISDVSESTYTAAIINGEVPTEVIVNQSDVSSDGTSGNWWGLAIYIGARPANFPKLGSIIVPLFNAISSDPPNASFSLLDAMSLSGVPFSRSEYKTVYGFLAFDADPSTAIGVLTSSLDGSRGLFLPLNPLFYDIKVIADGSGP